MGDLQRQGTGWQGVWAKCPRNSGICLACAGITVQIRCLPINPFLLPGRSCAESSGYLFAR